MPVYKSKLKSIADSSNVSLNEYYENNSPYTGYVILSKYLSNNGSNEYGLFNNDNITKEYLSRGDGNAPIEPNCAVDLSEIYEQSIGQTGNTPSPYHLACAALGKDIGNDDNYFYHYMDIKDSSDTIVDAGFPFTDDNEKNSVITPYSESTYSKPIYANFAIVGMSKAATPYINAGLFLENLPETLTNANFDFSYLGNKFGDGNDGIYEFPGYSGLSTKFAEILWYDAENAWADGNKNDQINTTSLNEGTGTKRELDEVIETIATKILDKLTGTNSYNNVDKTLKNLSSVIYNLVITNGKDFYKMLLSEKLFSGQATSNGVKKLDENDDDYNKNDEYIEQRYAKYRISLVNVYGNNGEGNYDAYFTVYTSSANIISGLSEFNRDLDDYYNEYGEPIVLDHSKNMKISEYILDSSNNTNNNIIIRPTDDASTYYYVVARPACSFLNSDIIKKVVIDQIKKRHTSYLTRYEAIGLDSNTFYSEFNAIAHPLINGNMLDSSLVSVISDNTSPVTFNNTKASKKGMVYVSSITLHFRGDTTGFTNKIKISSTNNNNIIEFGLNETKYICSDENSSRTSYKISFKSSNASVAYIGYSDNSELSNNHNAPTKLGMTCDICGSHQMVRYNSGNCKCKSYIDHLTDASAGIDSQWTLLKLSGVFKIQMSGRGTYSTSNNNDTDIILEAVDVEITDETNLQVGINYIRPISYTVYCTNTAYPHIENLYNGLNQKVMKETSTYTTYDASCVFFNSLCGAKRMNYKEDYYNDSSILSHNWSTAYQKIKVSVHANDSSNPVIAIGGYGNALDSSIYVSAAYDKSIVSNASFSDYTDDSGKIVDPVVKTIDDDNKIQALKPNSSSTGYLTVYKTITNDSSINNLNDAFKVSNTLRYSLPKPDVKLALDYKSVEFNGSSAWTFTRSMPLNAASAANPHILIYKIEAWIETVDENENLIIDKKASAAIAISDINGDNAHKVYSGRTHEIIENGKTKTLRGIDYAVQTNEIINNLYLKYNDNETNIYNAVSTSLPIKLLEPATLPLGEDNADMEIVNFYGGNALNYTVISDTYNENNEAKIIQNMYSAIKDNISNDVQACLCSYIGDGDGIGITNDGKRIIYFGIGFYNNSDLIMPITAIFGIDLTFTDSDTGVTSSYSNRISLNEFFPKDSIFYMAGKNYKNSIESDENSKIRFVKQVSGESYLLNDSGLKIYDREGILTSGNIIQEGEVVNIGAGILTSYDSSSHNEGEIHASSIEIKNETDVTSLYGIFNIYSGEVNYISTGSSKITNAGLPDVIVSSENEDSSTGSYSNYVKFMNEISGKCLTKSQHICKFIHCTDNNIPYVI